MKTLDVTLPDDLQAFAREEAARRGFKDPSGFVQSLLEAEKHRQMRQELEAMLLEAADGPFSEWTDQDVDDIRFYRPSASEVQILRVIHGARDIERVLDEE